MSNLHISISAEQIANIGGLSISNSMLTSLIVSALLILFAFAGGAAVQHRSGKPTRFQVFVEFVVESLRNLVQSITDNSKKTALFFPLIASFFLFILMNNWIGLFPGVGTIGFIEKEAEAHASVDVENTSAQAYASTTEEVTTVQVDELGATVPADGEAVPEAYETGVAKDTTNGEAGSEKTEGGTFVPYLRAATADLNTNIALALVSVTMTQIWGVKFLKLKYFSKYINFSSPINFAVGLLEIVLELAKIVSFAFRLFGNIFAGEVLLAVIAFLIPVIAPMPFYGLELFVGFIQALVFSMLSLVFFNMATMGHGDEH